VYRYDESQDEITIWSTNSRDGLSAEAELYRMDFSRIEKHGKGTAVVSRLPVGEGLKDVDSEARVDFRFLFTGVSLENFTFEKLRATY